MASILVVDDEPDILEMLQRVLENAFPSHEILAATGGEMGLYLLERRRPDVAVVDYKLPGLGGLELAMEAYERGLDTPIIIMTAFADSSVEARVRKAPTVKGFFQKPLNPPELVEEIRTLLASRGRQQSPNPVTKRRERSAPGDNVRDPPAA